MEARTRADCGPGGAPPEERAPEAAGAPGAGTAPPPSPGATTPNTPGQAPAPAGTAQPAGPADDGAIANAAAREKETGADVPAPLVALLVTAGLLALAGLLWGLFRFFAWEPRWLLSARHAVAEAGWRTGGAWAEFTDWLRARRSAA